MEPGDRWWRSSLKITGTSEEKSHNCDRRQWKAYLKQIFILSIKILRDASKQVYRIPGKIINKDRPHPSFATLQRAKIKKLKYKASTNISVQNSGRQQNLPLQQCVSHSWGTISVESFMWEGDRETLSETHKLRKYTDCALLKNDLKTYVRKPDICRLSRVNMALKLVQSPCESVISSMGVPQATQVTCLRDIWSQVSFGY